MSTVTVSNKKATKEAHMKCRATGLFMSDATPDFKTLAVTHSTDRAFVFPCAEAAEHARKFLCSLYGSFDWQVVPLQRA